MKIEIIPFFAKDGKLFRLARASGESWSIGTDGGSHPHEVVADAMRQLAEPVRLIHSTSWRYDDGRVVLTYAVIVDPPPGALPGGLNIEEVGPPSSGHTGSRHPSSAAVTHAAQHLAFLADRDKGVMEATSSWTGQLQGFKAAPFWGPEGFKTGAQRSDGSNAEYEGKVRVEILPFARTGNDVYQGSLEQGTWKIGLSGSLSPHALVKRELKRKGLPADAVISTSWRHENGELVLTYAVVTHPSSRKESGLVFSKVTKAEIVQGGATTPNPNIPDASVSTHALRTLFIQRGSDGRFRKATPGWAAALRPYQPED